MPEGPAFYAVIAAITGLALLVTSLAALIVLGRSRVVKWMQLNIMTLPAVILVNVAVWVVRRHIIMLPMLPDTLPLDPVSLLTRLVNPVVIAIIVGAATARPLWRLISPLSVGRSNLSFDHS